MRAKIVPLLAGVAALAALAATVAYAAVRATDGGGSPYGMMGGFAMMGPAEQGTAWYLDGTGKPVSDIAAARARAQLFADRLGLKTAEVMQFTDNFYVRLDDSQGKGATEVLVDPRSGAVTLEYGPAMMWNTRYGMMNGSGGMMGAAAGSAGMMGGSGGMMGRYGGSPSWTPPAGVATAAVSAAEARRIADRWLAVQRPGATAGTPDALPGYYTMETRTNGKIDGMLSVNERTGALWYHWWHGRFVAMEA